MATTFKLGAALPHCEFLHVGPTIPPLPVSELAGHSGTTRTADTIRSTATVTTMQPRISTSATPDRHRSINSPTTPDLAARLQLALAPRFLVERELGGGAMSTVYLARDLTNGLPVAVKMIADPDSADRTGFRREAAVTHELRHPNILPLLEAGETPGLTYLVTPFVNGGSLRDRLDAHGPLPPLEVARILHSLAVALSHAHSHGIIHGDVKPENVLLDGKHVLLADFGAARVRNLPWRTTVRRATGEHPATAAPTVGTPRYMSPEQALGDPDLDPRSDIYSLAVVGVELLTGRPLFTGPTTRAVLLAHLNQPAPSMAARPGVPLRLARVLDHSLQKLPGKRPASAAVVAAALAPLLERPAVPPFAPVLASGRVSVSRSQRVSRLASAVSTVSLGVAAAAASILLLVGVATPAPEELRLARSAIDSAASYRAAAPTRCGSTGTVDATAATSQNRAG